MDWLDITVPLADTTPAWPGDPRFEREFIHSIARGDETYHSVLRMSAHNGTHVDAPLHFIADGRTLEMIPASVLCGPCLVVDCGDAEWITADIVASASLVHGDRVLFKTRNSSLWGDPHFAEDAVGFDRGGAKALRDAGVALVGIDYLSVGSFRKYGIEVHHILLGAGIALLEGVNLSGVKPGRYELVCAPLLIPGAEAAPARVFLGR
jgi:arylformamidase